MLNHSIILPSAFKIASEKDFSGVYEIEGLSPGYGHTLGNSLRRVILSSLPGNAVTSVKIDGVSHEFSTIEGVKEDVITILLNLKRVHFGMMGDEPQEVELHVKGPKKVTAADIKTPGQISVLNPDQFIAEITKPKTKLDVIIRVERGLGYIPKERLHREKTEVGTIALDATFTPIRRVNYEVENMRVGDRTDCNRLRISIETDGTITPKEVLESALTITIEQLESILGLEKKAGQEVAAPEEEKQPVRGDEKDSPEEDWEFLKTRVDTLDFSARTANALAKANIRTVGGLSRKSEKDLLDLEGLGEKGLKEIKRTLSNFGVTLK